MTTKHIIELFHQTFMCI